MHGLIYQNAEKSNVILNIRMTATRIHMSHSSKGQGSLLVPTTFWWTSGKTFPPYEYPRIHVQTQNVGPDILEASESHRHHHNRHLHLYRLQPHNSAN